MADDALPFDGPVLIEAAALSSVGPQRLPDLLRRVQRHLADRRETYRRSYERVVDDSDREAFLAEPDHWDGVADELGLSDRERDAVRRAHERQLERLGSATDRREEFETALDVRTAVVVGRE